jgi:hypothetical protein
MKCGQDVALCRDVLDLELLGAAVTPALERRVDVVIEAGGDNAAA